MSVVMDPLGRLGLLLPRAGARGAVLALGLLAGCGGGSQVDEFNPKSLTVFGDEANVIRASDGARYTVNGVDSTSGAIACGSNPIWVQRLASNFGFGFPECPNGRNASAGRIYAQPGSGVAELKAQVDLAIAQRGAFKKTDLVTIYTGQNSIIDLYVATSPTSDECRFDSNNASNAGSVSEQAIRLGRQVAIQINRIAPDTDGGRVLFATVPDLGTTPRGRAEADRGDCLTNLARAFNSGLRTEVKNDGKLIGLVELDEQVRLATDDNLGFDNVSAGACSVSLPDCTTSTLTNGATTSNYFDEYLWADDLHFGPRIHDRIGSRAIDRAENNPF